MAKQEHFVYLYRDKRDQVFYCGYGQSASRAIAAHSHNAEVAKKLRDKNVSIEIVGPFDSMEWARRAETIAISATRGKYQLNRNRGFPEWRFRPLGIPKEFAKRIDEKPITPQNIGRMLFDKNQNPSIIFVLVTSKDFGDGRVGYDLGSPPSEEQILERIDRWWRLNENARKWSDFPQESPTLLIGVTGKPSYRMVIGAVRVNPKGWSSAVAEAEKVSKGSHTKNTRIRIPTLPPYSLDAFKLRGLLVNDLVFPQHGHVIFPGRL